MKKLISLLSLLLLFGCSNEPNFESDDWSKLIDPAFDQQKIVRFYKEKVLHVSEGSKEEKALYAQMQMALKNGGNNKAMDGKKVKLSGYLVPIDTDGEMISSFLFFPNQAACIHVPASPANQTIYVKAKKDEGVLMEDVYENIIVYGTIKLQHTEIANATSSYVIQNATCKAVPRL